MSSLRASTGTATIKTGGDPGEVTDSVARPEGLQYLGAVFLFGVSGFQGFVTFILEFESQRHATQAPRWFANGFWHSEPFAVGGGSVCRPCRQGPAQGATASSRAFMTMAAEAAAET